MKCNYDDLIKFLKEKGFDRIQEDIIHDNGEVYINCYNKKDKRGLNLSVEFY